jgi:hypothetical protein
VASPTGASAETSAADRCANCQGCEPSDLKTCTRSDGKPPRPTASMPDAQPTNKRPDQDEAASLETKPTASPTSAADGLREPQRPAKANDEHIEIIHIKITFKDGENAPKEQTQDRKKCEKKNKKRT